MGPAQPATTVTLSLPALISKLKSLQSDADKLEKLGALSVEAEAARTP